MTYFPAGQASGVYQIRTFRFGGYNGSGSGASFVTLGTFTINNPKDIILRARAFITRGADASYSGYLMDGEGFHNMKDWSFGLAHHWYYHGHVMLRMRTSFSPADSWVGQYAYDYTYPSSFPLDNNPATLDVGARIRMQYAAQYSPGDKTVTVYLQGGDPPGIYGSVIVNVYRKI